MSVYLFPAIIILLMCSPSFAVAHHAVPLSVATTGEKRVEIFKDECLNALKPSGSNVEKINKFDNVFFVTTDKMLVAVAESQYTTNGGGNKNTIDFLSASVDITQTDWDKKIFKQDGPDNCGEWKTQIATTKKVQSDVFSTIKNVFYDATKEKLYICLQSTIHR